MQHSLPASLRRVASSLPPRTKRVVAAAAGLCVLFALFSPPIWGPPRTASLGAVIPLSSLEALFAADTIREALRVASPVVVVYADRLSDGTPEDLSYVAALQHALAGAASPPGALVWVPVAWHAGPPSRFWVRYARWAGLPFAATDYILWLDADEVLDAERFATWWASPRGLPATGADAIKLANYVYFREPRYQSEQLEDSAVISRRRALHSTLFFDDPSKEREMFFDGLAGGRRAELSVDGFPLVHHFSWCRGSKEGMLKKVAAWSHNADDKDWKALVEKEYEHPFGGVDFVNGHTYRTLVKPWIEELRQRRGVTSTSGVGETAAPAA